MPNVNSSDREAHSLKNPVPTEKSRPLRVGLKLRGNKLTTGTSLKVEVFKQIWSNALEVLIENKDSIEVTFCSLVNRI